MVKALALGAAFGLLAAGPAFAEGEGARHEEGPERPGKALSPEEESKVLDFLRENAPEMARHLEGARRERPEEYRRHLPELAKMTRDPDMRVVFIKNANSEAKVRKAAEAVRRAEGADKDRLAKELETALGEQFDAKLAQQELQVKKMTDELAKLKERIEARRAKKAAMVKKRLAEMTGDGDGWDW